MTLWLFGQLPQGELRKLGDALSGAGTTIKNSGQLILRIIGIGMEPAGATLPCSTDADAYLQQYGSAPVLEICGICH